MHQESEDRNAFLVRCYQWALRLWDRELQEDFPLLRSFDGLATQVAVALHVMAQLGKDDRRTVAEALTRRSHAEALTILGRDKLTTDEVVLESWREARMRTRPFQELGVVTYHADGLALRRRVTEVLATVAGSRDRAGRRYSLRSGNWVLHTDVEFGGGSRQFEYYHTILRRDELVKRAASLPSILGVGNGAFDRVDRGQEEQAARCLELVIRAFLDGFHTCASA